MSWISMNIDKILEIIRPRWDDFLSGGGYDGIKYPEEIYRNLLTANTIDDRWVSESLVWKYGKWKQYVNERNIPSKLNDAINKFIQSRDILISLKTDGNPSRCREVLKSFPDISSIFLSHLIFPDFWAIVDQHTLRFLHWIHLQIENYRVEKTSLWDLSQELNQLQLLLSSKLHTTKRDLDKFMMTLGKRLKQTFETSAFKNKKRSIVNKFHFKEIDWIIYFPSRGNEGRQLVNYGVAYRDRINRKTQPGPKINLGNVFGEPLIQNGYPHSIGLFLDSSGKGPNWTPVYVETREINNKDEFLDWIREIEEE